MLKLLLIFPLLLLSQDSFTLPDESTYFISTLNEDLLSSTNEVFISSSIINNYTTIKTLRDLSKKNVSIILVTQEQVSTNTAFALGLLQNISVYKPKGDNPLLGTLVCIDDKIMYLSTTNLDYKSLRRDYAFVIKQDRTCKKQIKDLLNKSIKIK